jgi:hypothetical protein
MNKRNFLVGAIALGLAFVASQATAAELVPVNFDDPGEGYNDPTPAAPVGGNPGTSIGEQRQIVAQFAADLWSAVLVSNQPIYVGAQFNPLAPNVLGSAGASFIFRNFPNAGVANTWYSAALADSLADADLNPGYTDIGSQFSSNYNFYYGLDGNTPAGQLSFLDVVMHEFGHGLGFQNFENEATGAFQSGIPDIYSTFTYDNSTNKRWTQMSVSERVASALNYGNVVFDGANATHTSQLVLGPRTGFRVFAPAGAAGDYPYGTAAFGPAAGAANFAGSVVLALDDVNAAGPSGTDACTAITNAAAVAGHVAIVDRGGCAFAIKTKNLQDAGATAVIMANTGATAAQNPPPGMAGADPAIVIPTIMLTQAVGNSIKANLPGVTVGFVVDASKLQGADDAGHPRLYMPNPVASGSSGSHYDTAAEPNALMEPAINDSLNGALYIDASAALLQDTGWQINAGTAKIDGCDTTIDVIDDGGIIVGANVQAQSNLCKAGASSHGDYQSCMDAYKDRLEAANLVTGKQAGKMMACAAKVKL